MLIESPLGDINHACPFQNFIEICDGRGLLSCSESMVFADLCQVLLQYDSCQHTSRPDEAIFHESLCGFQLRVEQISLNDLSDIEEGTLEASFNSFDYRQLLPEPWSRGRGTNNLFVSHTSSTQ